MLKEPPLVTNLQAGMEKTELGTKLLVFEQTQKMSRSKEIYPLLAAEKTKFSGRIESEPKPPKLFGSIRRRKRVATILEMFELDSLLFENSYVSVGETVLFKVLLYQFFGQRHMHQKKIS